MLAHRGFGNAVRCARIGPVVDDHSVGHRLGHRQDGLAPLEMDANFLVLELELRDIPLLQHLEEPLELLQIDVHLGWLRHSSGWRRQAMRTWTVKLEPISIHATSCRSTA